MPKASLNPDKARQGGGGVEAGNYEVTAAKFQNIKTDYKPNQLNLVLDCAVLDKDGAQVRGADPVDIQFSFGQKSLEAFHPGQGSGPDDADPKDMGEGVDAEGNTIYATTADSQFNKSCGAIVFGETLVKAGFPKNILDRCWAPDFIGLKFSLETRTGKEVNEKFGTRLSTKPTADGNTVTYKICQAWLNPNYLAGGGQNGAAAGAANGQAAAAPVAEAPQTAEEIAAVVLKLVAEKKAGEKNKIKTAQALVGFFTNEFTKAKMPPKMLAASQALIKDANWIENAVAELGGTYIDGVTTFPG